MRHHHLAARQIGGDLGQTRGDEVIGQAVKTVAANAFLRQVAGQGESLLLPGLPNVEGCVETGDLRQRGHQLADQPDRRQVVGLMQGRQRHIAFKIV